MSAPNEAAQTPLVDLLRRIHPDATAEIAEPNGWTYHTFGLGRTMHRAADEIERLTAELDRRTRRGTCPPHVAHRDAKYCEDCGIEMTLTHNPSKSRQEAPGRAE